MRAWGGLADVDRQGDLELAVPVRGPLDRGDDALHEVGLVAQDLVPVAQVEQIPPGADQIPPGADQNPTRGDAKPLPAPLKSLPATQIPPWGGEPAPPGASPGRPWRVCTVFACEVESFDPGETVHFDHPEP